MSEHRAVVGWWTWWGLGVLIWPCSVPLCSPSLGEVLALGLRAFTELMEHGVVSWETLSIPFVRKVGGPFYGQRGEVVSGSGPPWWSWGLTTLYASYRWCAM